MAALAENHRHQQVDWDVEANGEARRRSLDDFLIWRQEMRSVEWIAALSMLGTLVAT